MTEFQFDLNYCFMKNTSLKKFTDCTKIFIIRLDVNLPVYIGQLAGVKFNNKLKGTFKASLFFVCF